MFEAIKNDKIIKDLNALAAQLKQINDHCAEANSSTIGRMSTKLKDELSKVAEHVREMVQAKLRQDELEADTNPETDIGSIEV